MNCINISLLDHATVYHTLLYCTMLDYTTVHYTIQILHATPGKYRRRLATAEL